MPRVFISDKLEKAGVDILVEAGIEVDNRPGLKGDELKEAIRRADGMVVRSGTRLTAELLEDPGQLRAVVRGGVGVDNIDVAAATRNWSILLSTTVGKGQQQTSSSSSTASSSSASSRSASSSVRPCPMGQRLAPAAR